MATAALACRAALAEATRLWPHRNRASDGIMGDPRHAGIRSDHNDGNAYDLTHDPENGVDCDVLSRRVTNDPRTKYVIWERRIWSKARQVEGWRPYSGSNPHEKHMHVSIYGDEKTRNNTAPWWSMPVAHPPDEPAPQPTPTPQELPDVFIAYYPSGQAFLMYANGTKRLIAGEDIGALKAILPVALAPRLLDATPNA